MSYYTDVGLGSECAAQLCSQRYKGGGCNEKQKARPECDVDCVIANFEGQLEWLSDRYLGD